MVEVKQVDLPEQMIRAIARQAEAERERRAKIIHAEGEAAAAANLEKAAEMMARAARRDPAPLPADAGGDRLGEEYHSCVSAADGYTLISRPCAEKLAGPEPGRPGLIDVLKRCPRTKTANLN